MQDCPNDRQEEAQTAVYGTSLQVLCRWALHLSSLLQNLLQAGRQLVHHVVWPGQAAADQARRLGYKRAKRRNHQLGSLLQSSQACQPKSSAVANDYTVPGDIAYLSDAKRSQA